MTNADPSTESGTTGERRMALRAIAMPAETNPYGAIFGGVILSYIDQAGFIEARRHGSHRWVTVSINRVDFKAPVLVGGHAAGEVARVLIAELGE